MKRILFVPALIGFGLAYSQPAVSINKIFESAYRYDVSTPYAYNIYMDCVPPEKRHLESVEPWMRKYGYYSFNRRYIEFVGIESDFVIFRCRDWWSKKKYNYIAVPRSAVMAGMELEEK